VCACVALSLARSLFCFASVYICLFVFPSLCFSLSPGVLVCTSVRFCVSYSLTCSFPTATPQACVADERMRKLVEYALPRLRFSATAGNALLLKLTPSPQSVVFGSTSASATLTAPTPTFTATAASAASTPVSAARTNISVPRARIKASAVDGRNSRSHGALTTEKIGGRLRLDVVLMPPQPEPAAEFARRVIKHLLVDRAWHGVGDEDPFTLLNPAEIIQLCQQVRLLLKRESTLVEIRPPCRVFGDIHGQLRQLLELFERYGSPNHYNGDVKLIHYVFNGDFVDRGPNSLEVICLLFSLKVLYPKQITLLR
jgi:Calcineurin-like phosphoesterase